MNAFKNAAGMQRKCPERPEQLAFLQTQHNNLEYRAESYVISQSPNGFAGRCFLALGCESSIKPLTCTTFDPASLPPESSNFKEFRGFLTALSNGRNAGLLLPTGIWMPLGLIKRHTGQHSRQHAPTVLFLMPDCLQNRSIPQGVPDVLASVFQQIRGKVCRQCTLG